MRAPAERRGRRPLIVLGLGLLGVAVVMLLLYGPFHGAAYEAPGTSLHRWLASQMSRAAQATGLEALHRLASWVMYDFVPLLIMVLVLVMAVLPAAVAFRRRSRHDDAAGAGRPRDDAAEAARPQDDSRADGTGAGTSRSATRDRDRLASLVFSDDGSIAEVGAVPAEDLELGIGELRALAEEAGLPWRSRYGTEGGARGFLEILRARQEGPMRVRRTAGAAGAGAAGAATATAAGESDPVRHSDVTTSGAESSAPVPSEPEKPAPVAPASEPSAPSDGEPPALSDTASSEPSDGEPWDLSESESSDEALWTPGSIGSVYTPTTLYSSGQGTEDAPDGASDADGAEEER